MKSIISALALLICIAIPALCPAASPALTSPATGNVGANMATLLLQSDGTGTGYFTLLSGSGAACGTGPQVAAGQTSTGVTAPYHGSLPLTANTAGTYTVSNLMQNSAYTICFTADSPSGANLNSSPATANLTTAATTAFTNPYWGVVGSAGFSAGSSYFHSLAIAPDGTPYVAYEDGANSAKATVMKYSGGAWSVVGSAGFSVDVAYFTSLAIAPDGTPYVAYEDNCNSHKATVMKYSGGAWSTVGSAGFSAGEANYTSLAFAPDGTPYVAYMDNSNNYKATVMTYSGGSWSTVGSAGFSSSEADYTSLAIAPDGTPYIAYRDYGNSYKATVMRYNGSAWSTVGSAGFSVGGAYFTSLAFAPDGAPYVAYEDVNNSGKATVMKLKSSSTISVASDHNPAVVGQSVTFIATVAPATATGTVTFQDGSTVLGTATLAGGTATCAATALTVGSHSITAVYAGDISYIGSTSSALAQTVNSAPLAINTSSLPSGLVSNSYSQSLAASGGVPPYTWGVLSGILPYDLNLNSSTGLISGTPTKTGVFSFGVWITDNGGGNTSKALDITVTDAACANAPVRIYGATPVYFPDFLLAYQAATDNKTIQLQALDFSGDFLLDQDLQITLEGGCDCGYSSNSGATGILGMLQVARGTVTVKNLMLK